MSGDPSLDTQQYRRPHLKHHSSRGTFSSTDMDGSGGGGEQDDEESFSVHHARRFGGNYHHEEEHDDHHDYSDLASDDAAKEAEILTSGGGKFSTAVPHDSLWFDNSPPKGREDDDDDELTKKSGGVEGLDRKRASAAFATPQSSSPHSLRQTQADLRRIPEASAMDDSTENILSTQGNNGEEGSGGGTVQTPFDYTSSESEEDRNRFQHQFRRQLSSSDANGQKSGMISSFPGMGGRARRDSGLPPIQLTAAKRLPHYPPTSSQASTNSTPTTPNVLGAANKSSSASSLVSTPMAIEEEEEEEEEEDADLQQQRLRRQQQLQQYSNEHLNRQQQQQYSNEHVNRQQQQPYFSQSEDMDSEDLVESLEIQEKPPAQPQQPNLLTVSHIKQTTSNSAAKKPPVVYSEPPDRGPADLSNPSLALAEALIAARAQAESRKNATTSQPPSSGAARGATGSGADAGGRGAAASAGANDDIIVTITSRQPPQAADASQKTGTPSSKDRLLQQQQQQRQSVKSAGTLSATGTTGAPTSPSSQVRIPIPQLSPMLRGQQSPWDHHHHHHHQQQQHLIVDGGMDTTQMGSNPGRSPESLRPIAMIRRTSFTLSPTSSNPELGHSQTDSHSGDSLMAAHLIGRGAGQDFRHRDSQLGSSYDSNRYDRGGAHHQPRRHDSPSYSSASSPPTHHHHHHHRHGHPRFPFSGRDVDQQSMEEEEMPHYDHPTRRRSSQHQHHHSHYRDPSSHGQYESSINDDTEDPFRSRHRPSLPHKQHHHHHQASASEVSAYPLSVSSRSLEESHDEHSHRHHHHHHQQKQQQHRRHQGEAEGDDDHEEEDEDDIDTTSSAAAQRIAEDEQLRAETEYIMSRNAELLKILAIRDDEIQTLQQELEHTLKVMHEYENDLMEMHSAAAQPYESYHQTLDEIGREMTQQDALLKGYKEENEKLAGQCRSLVNIRNEAEKRHLEKVEELKTEMERLQAMLDEAKQQASLSVHANGHQDGSAAAVADLEKTVGRVEALRERERSSYLDKEEEYLSEIAMLRDRVTELEKVLEDEKRNKVEDMQRLERNFQDVRDGYDGMVEQIKNLGVGVALPPAPLTTANTDPATTSTKPTATTGASITVSARPLLLHRESSSDETSSATSSVKHSHRRAGESSTPVSGIHSRGSASSSSLHQNQNQTPPLQPHEIKPSSQTSRPRGPDRKLTSTETLTTANMPKVMSELGLDQRISRFEADIRQSLMRSSSMDSFASVQSSSNASNAAAAAGANTVTGNNTTSPTSNTVGNATIPSGMATGSSITTAPSSAGPSANISSSSSVVVSQRPSGEQLGLAASLSSSSAAAAESQQVLANKLRDRINILNAENQRLHQELATLSQAMRQQQAERQRKVKQLEDLLDLHESVAEKKLLEDRAVAAAAAAAAAAATTTTTTTPTIVPINAEPGSDEKGKKDPSSDPSTVEGQQRIRKIIQGLLVRIRTKEAEAEFYHNAYLDKVLELDQLALKANNTNNSKGLLFSPVQGPVNTAAAGEPGAAAAVGTPVSPLSLSAEQAAQIQQQQQQQQQQLQQQLQQQQQQQQQTITALENRVMELEQANLELTIRLQVEQRRAQARESENTALTREKLVLVRLLEDQIEELKAKLASTELAQQKLLEENATLRERGAKDAAAVAAAAKAATTTTTTMGIGSGSNGGIQSKNGAQEEQLAILRSRMSSLTRQRDQLREQLQEALDIQLTMSQESGNGNGVGATVLKPGTSGGTGTSNGASGHGGARTEWTVDDYKRLERALEEKTTELCLWKERAIALEKVVERIRMIKVKPDVFGSASGSAGSGSGGDFSGHKGRERASGHDSETGSVSSASSASMVDHARHHQHYPQRATRRGQGSSSSNSKHAQPRPPLSHSLEELDQIVLKLEQRLERRDQELREVVLEAKRQTDMRLEQWKAKWVQVVQRKNAEIRRFQIELEGLMKAVDRDRQRMMVAQQQQQHQQKDGVVGSGGSKGSLGVAGGSKLRAGGGMGPGMHLLSRHDDHDDDHDLMS